MSLSFLKHIQLVVHSYAFETDRLIMQEMRSSCLAVLRFDETGYMRSSEGYQKYMMSRVSEWKTEILKCFRENTKNLTIFSKSDLLSYYSKIDPFICRSMNFVELSLVITIKKKNTFCCPKKCHFAYQQFRNSSFSASSSPLGIASCFVFNIASIVGGISLLF